jgi:hypothetical protein
VDEEGCVKIDRIKTIWSDSYDWEMRYRYGARSGRAVNVKVTQRTGGDWEAVGMKKTSVIEMNVASKNVTEPTNLRIDIGVMLKAGRECRLSTT